MNEAMTIVIAPDSFKGSLSAVEAAEAMREGLLRVFPAGTLRLRPMADGGEGTLEALLAAGGERWVAGVRDAGGAVRESALGILADGIGVIEVAEIVGITDDVGLATPVGRRSTWGVGDAVRLLLDRGCREIRVALGGSSTNDAGAGMLAALGVTLLDRDGNVVMPVPEELGCVVRVDVSGIDARVGGCRLLVLSDVRNSLGGEHGATAVFGGQKGVLPEQVAAFDANLLHFAGLLEDALGRTAREMPGAGAAGGLGFALRMLGAEVRSGGEVVADLLGLDEALTGADWAITGEGRSDAQTLGGKTPFVVCQRGQRLGVPVTLISGSLAEDASARLGEHFAGCFSIVPGPMGKAAAIAGAGALLANAAEQAGRLWAAARRSRS